MAKLTRAIDGLIRWMDKPRFPEKCKGYAFTNDFSTFRRAIPIDAIDEMTAGDEFFMDNTLDIVGNRPQCITTLCKQTLLPLFCSIRRAPRKSGVIMQKGVPYQLDSSGIKKDGGRNKLITLRSFVFLRDGRYYPGSHYDNRVGRIIKTDDSLMKQAKAVSGAALTYYYHGQMEIPLVNGTSISMPLCLDQIREVLKDRDKPETGCRRPALAHLVRQHRRNLKDGEAVRVREHLRGKISCHWRGWDVVIHPSAYDQDRLAKGGKDRVCAANP